MRRVVAGALLLLFWLFLLPLGGGYEGEPVVTVAPSPSPTAVVAKVDGAVTAKVLMEGQVAEMPLADYLWGVVAAEMPASFELEALKAQAVAVRTYYYHRLEDGAVNHLEATVCTDSGCCQAYTDVATAQAGWGADADYYTEKIRQAVAETDGEIITYGGAPIDALYCSSVDGETKDAVAVWGQSVPYLVPVFSPEGGEVTNYVTTVAVPLPEFLGKMKGVYPTLDLTGDPGTWAVDGETVRTLFGLRSSSYTLAVDETEAVFTVTGYGHGVGMSQYGANALAKEGWIYGDILTHYYTGTTLKTP